jgi:hypothetical protein
MTLDPRLRLELGRAHADQLRREATRATGRRRLSQPDVSRADLSVVIRPERPEDRAALARLAELDSARLPAAPVLVAVVGGELRAALSLSDGAAIADPFHRTAWLMTLLTVRAGQLRGEPAGDRRRFERLRRVAARVPAFALPRL